MLAHPACADQANVFVYHRFNDSRYPSTNITVENFQAQLEVLRQQKFTVLKLGQVIDKMYRGLSLPQRCAVITVDDAYRSFMTDGWPLLKQYGYPVTLFVSTDTVGGNDFLSWHELQTLQDEGVEIGNHSASHDYLLDRVDIADGAEWYARVMSDIRRSQRALETHLGIPAQLFAYPYGEFSPELALLIKEAGFVAAFGQQSGVITADQDFYQLPRFPMGGAISIDEFRSKLFLNSLAVRALSPEDNLITGEIAPVLRFYLKQDNVDNRTLRCFVSGSAEACLVTVLNAADGLYEVKTLVPIIGRRFKYTLTASDTGGKKWYWFSQLWVRPRGNMMTDHFVPR
jgi:peptidoglycan/xylan/chitin deacetylase (PgdA/CDA1 family)